MLHSVIKVLSVADGSKRKSFQQRSKYKANTSIWLGIHILRILLVSLNRKVHLYRDRMNRLHKLKNQYPIDLFSSLVACLRSDQQTLTCLMSDDQRVMINFMCL